MHYIYFIEDYLAKVILRSSPVLAEQLNFIKVYLCIKVRYFSEWPESHLTTTSLALALKSLADMEIKNQSLCRRPRD